MIVLNSGEEVPKCTKEKHLFVVTKKPQGCNSGWWEEKCEHCGIEIGYDTTD